MTPNDSHASRGYSDGGGVRPSVTEESLRIERIQIERKAFIFALKENPRGRFLRITEDVGDGAIPSSSPPLVWKT